MSKFFIIEPLKDGLYTGFKFKKSLKDFEFLPEISASELKNKKVYLVLDAPVFFIEITELSGTIPSFIQIQAENRVKESGLFTSPPKTIYKLIEATQTTSRVFIFAMEEKLINKHLDILRREQVKVEVVTHKILSAFSLFKHFMQNITDFPVLIVILNSAQIWYVVCSSQYPIYAKFSAIDEFLGISLENIINDILFIKDYTFRFHGEEIKHLVIIGKEHLRDLKDLSEKVKIPLKSLNIFKEALNYPEIFGVLYLENTYNLLPVYEKNFLNQLKLIEKIIPFMISFTVLSGVAGLVLFMFNSKLENNLNREQTLIRKLLNELSYKLPKNKIKQIEIFVNLEKEKRENIRIDQFLVWLSQIWEKNFIFDSLKIEPVQDSFYKFFLKIQICGNFLYSHKKAEELIDKIDNYFTIEKTDFVFSEKENKGILALEFTSKNESINTNL
ncbi:hypothetical protein DRN73_05145 [Candidatus Pacearchaeota archaeon]|nr:MAG: hypothetical protein DRN73_05145 [Candidatus Pacearchaeota archaeon]